ncbi:AAA family ATPase [Geodermatophilus sp. SYSU D00742]
MRPVRLDMDGFASFREPTNVDFTDADYFALVGPTGAGKSTVIDALTFALFGTVPRWENKKALSYALAPTANRGTVRLVFDLDGSRYVAARELRRTRQGVQQKNARLERLDDRAALGGLDDPTEVLAADGQVTGAVEGLLGLTFEHFTQCVVLPQGEFAQFLKASPATRRTMLLKLLGADLYFDIGRRANARASLAGERAQLLADQLTRFGDATAEAQAVAEGRVAELTALSAAVGAALPRLAAADDALTAAQVDAERLAAEHTQLTAVRIPAGLDELDAELRAAQATLTGARTVEEAAQAADTAARTELDAAPARGPLEQARRDHADRDRLTGQLPAAAAAVEDAEQRLATATAAHRDALEALAAARQRRDTAAAAARDAAAEVTRLAGETDALHRVVVPADLPALDERVRAAATALAAAEDALAAAEGAEDAARAALTTAPARAPLERDVATLGELNDARAALDGLRAADGDAATALAAAEGALAAAAEQVAAARAHRDAAAVTDGAAALRAHLAVGAACPVCEQTVAVLPAAAEASAVDAAERSLTEAVAAHAAAQDVERAAARAAADARAALTAADRRVETLTAALSGAAADPAALRAELDRLDALDAAATEAAAALRAARAARVDAHARMNGVEADAAAHRSAFTTARDSLVSLGAPAAGDGSLLESWTALATWAAEAGRSRSAALADAQQAADATAGALTDAERAFGAAEAGVADRRAGEAAASGAHGSAVTELRGLRERLAELDRRLDGIPGPDDVAAALRELDRLEVAAHAADEELRAARAARIRAQETLEGLTARDAAAWQTLRGARDRLVALGAPDLPAGSALAGWEALLDWAGQQAGERATALPTAQTAVAAAAEERQRLGKELTESLAAGEVTLEDGPLAQTAPAAVAAAVADARGEVRRIADRRAEAGLVSEQHAAAVTDQQVAKLLANMLRSDKFPEWLEAAALDTLVLTASGSLAELSGGQFELTHRDGEFFVVDHADADSLRSVRTLSGGETFQASLALALALSSQLSSLAASGAARLDSIFLDEGFGTLDETTLETVAGTLENLASGDRMVGVITHVAALAERVPVRFAVRRDARTSTITRETA